MEMIWELSIFWTDLTYESFLVLMCKKKKKNPGTDSSLLSLQKRFLISRLTFGASLLQYIPGRVYISRNHFRTRPQGEWEHHVT